jgi:hypothetical protein
MRLRTTNRRRLSKRWWGQFHSILIRGENGDASQAADGFTTKPARFWSTIEFELGGRSYVCLKRGAR